MKLLKILLEQEKILVPTRTKGWAEKYAKIIQKKIQQYIEDGSKGDLYLGGYPITFLPNNLEYVGGDLDLARTSITSLPDTLKYVEGSIFLEDTEIESLPDNLKIGRSLVLSKAYIPSLPDNLEIGRNLYIDHTPITSLPKNLKVESKLLIRWTPLAEKYTDEEIRNLADIGGKIVRWNYWRYF